jgi:hypothetical protein
MKKVVVASLLATLFVVSAVFAEESTSTQPVKEIEGPDIRLTQTGPSQEMVMWTGAPDIR